MVHKTAQKFKKDELILWKGWQGVFMRYTSGTPNMAWIRLPIPASEIKKVS